MHSNEPTRPDEGFASLPDEGFTRLVDRHTCFLYRVAYSVSGNAQDAEDAVQDTLLKLYRTGAWRQTVNDERAYLARAVWRTALDRRSTAEARALRSAEDVVELPLEAATLDPEEEALAGSDRALLRRLLARLPDDLRQPLLLSAIEGMSGREIALALNVAEPTVRTRVHRARAELRQMFLRESRLAERKLTETAQGAHR